MNGPERLGFWGLLTLATIGASFVIAAVVEVWHSYRRAGRRK